MRLFFENIKIGLVIGLFAIITGISYVSIIFTHELLPYLPYGIGAALISTMIMSPILVIMNKIPQMIVQTQHVICVILALMASTLTATLTTQGTPEQILPTLMALIAFSTVFLGVFFLCSGYFHWRQLISYTPYPVIAGVLAGIGWIIIVRSLALIIGFNINLENIPALMAPMNLLKIFSGIYIAVIIFLYMKRKISFLVLATFTLLFLITFFGSLRLTNTPLSHEWMLGPIPSGRLWPPPLQLSDFTLVNWRFIFSQLGSIAVMSFTAIISYLITTSGLDILLNKDIDADRALKSAGVANILSGFIGGIAGYQSMILSSLGHRLGARGPIAVYTASLLALASLFLDASYINYIPKPIVGGVLLFFGFNVVSDWVFGSIKKLPLIDFILVLIILASIAVLGFLPGLIIGIVIEVLIFIIDFSKIGIINYELYVNDYRQTFQANLKRPSDQEQVLFDRSSQIYIIKLRGFVFFGTANSLIQNIKNKMSSDKSTGPQYLIIDFQLVSGFDSSATFGLVKLKRFVVTHNIQLVITDVKPKILNLIKQADDARTNEIYYHVFSNLDEGIEWCENQILSHAGVEPTQRSVPFPVPDLLPYFEKKIFQAGEYVIHQGDQLHELYYIESGLVSVILELPGERTSHFCRLGAGSYIGEYGFYLEAPNANSVVANRTTIIYGITKAKLEDVKKENPLLVLGLHENIAQVMSERVLLTTTVLKSLIP